MGLFKKLKQGLGMGTVSVSVAAAPTAPASGGVIAGTVSITAESEQTITSITVTLQRCFEYSTLVTFTDSEGKTAENWSAHSATHVLGTWKDESPRTLREGESVAVDFSLGYEAMPAPYASSYNMDVWYFLPADSLEGRNLLAEPIRYQVDVQVDIDGAMFDKGAQSPLVITEG